MIEMVFRIKLEKQFGKLILFTGKIIFDQILSFKIPISNAFVILRLFNLYCRNRNIFCPVWSYY